MQKRIFILILVLLVALSSFAQSDTLKCNFLGPLHFKNGKAVVVVRAVYREFYRSGDEPYFTNLEKRKILRSKDYFMRCCGGSALSFVPENCSKEYQATMREGILFDINHFKPGEWFYLTCLVFEGIKGDYGDQFFAIIDISAKTPKSSK